MKNAVRNRLWREGIAALQRSAGAGSRREGLSTIMPV
jgi:hypothetical protein